MSDAPNTAFDAGQTLVDGSTTGDVIDLTDPTSGSVDGGLGFLDELSSLATSAESSLFSAADSVSAALFGVSQSDVKDGTVDPNTLSREQRAQLAIDGATGGRALNPWHVGVDLDAITLATLQSQGGGVLVFDVDVAAPLALADKLIPPRFALLADDTTILAQGPFDVAIVSSTPLVVQLGAPPIGSKLTLWIDSTLTVTGPRKVAPPGDLGKVIADEKAAQTSLLGDVDGAAGKIGDTIKGAVDRFFDVQEGVGLALVVVVGIAAFLFIESGGAERTAKAAIAGGAV